MNTIKRDYVYVNDCDTAENFMRMLSNESSKFVAGNLFSQIEYLEHEKEKYKDKFHRNRKTQRLIRNLITFQEQV